MPSLLLAENIPIIDLDSTVFLQLGVFVLMALILSQVLFKPYLAVRNARTAGIDGARDEAHRMDEEAQAKMAEYDHAFNAARTKANLERAKLQAEAVAREREIVEAARKATVEALDAAHASIARDAEGARAELQPRTREIAREIATKILGREVA
ncbi:MAG TPA: ATP synthase F0 subunit B [Haliangiales bacterium]|nr:ATP synthase F0 subunit B [Haliangiales bacterium]